jgi:hypothetical protein
LNRPDALFRGVLGKQICLPIIFIQIANLEMKDIHWGREMQSNSQPTFTREMKNPRSIEKRGLGMPEESAHSTWLSNI